MTDHLLVVFTNAADGRDAEFNDWYDNVHLADVLDIPGIVAAHRYEVDDARLPAELSPGPAHRYLALYELSRDPREVLDDLLQRVNDGRVPVSSTLDMATVRTWVYGSRDARSSASIQGETPLLVVLTNAADGRDAEFNDWYDNVHLADVLGIPGFDDAVRLEASDVALPRELSPVTDHRYLALYAMSGDRQCVLDELVRRVEDGRVPVSEDLDMGTVRSWAYRPRPVLGSSSGTAGAEVAQQAG